VKGANLASLRASHAGSPGARQDGSPVGRTWLQVETASVPIALRWQSVCRLMMTRVLLIGSSATVLSSGMSSRQLTKVLAIEDFCLRLARRGMPVRMFRSKRITELPAPSPCRPLPSVTSAATVSQTQVMPKANGLRMARTICRVLWPWPSLEVKRWLALIE